ncbi:hypothetical protein [Halalkalibaculum sp. DA384]|uniref:hypothetical protein n=1 Tax=Halalkalibaculum sp. DA384 TaxID=3373606 RepID=UPI003754F9E9
MTSDLYEGIGVKGMHLKPYVRWTRQTYRTTRSLRNWKTQNRGTPVRLPPGQAGQNTAATIPKSSVIYSSTQSLIHQFHQCCTPITAIAVYSWIRALEYGRGDFTWKAPDNKQ